MTAPTTAKSVAGRHWEHSVPIDGTLAEKYLDSRGLTGLDTINLAFNPSVKWRDTNGNRTNPALIGAASYGGADEFECVHAVLLDPEGGKVAKRTFGKVDRRGIYMGHAHRTLVVAEGIENALAARKLFGRGCPVATMGASNMPKLQIPTWAQEVVIAADGYDKNGVGLAKAKELSKSLSVPFRILVSSVRGDANDALLTDGAKLRDFSGMPAEHRAWTGEEISRILLANLDPSMPLADWIKVLMGVKAELGDGGREVAEAWSRGGSQYKPDDFDKHWRSIDAGGGVSLGTTIDMVRKAGFPVQRTGGRPKKNSQDFPVAGDTIRSMRSGTDIVERMERIEFPRMCKSWEKWNLIARDNPKEYWDTTRIMEWYMDRFLRIVGERNKQVSVLGDDGYWHNLRHTGRDDGSTGVVAKLCDEARNRSLDEATKHVGDEPDLASDIITEIEKSRTLWLAGMSMQNRKHLAEYISQDILAMKHEVEQRHAREFGDRDKHPVLPMASGGVFNLRTGKHVPPSEMGELLLRADIWPWSIPDIDFDLLDNTDDEAVKVMRRECEGRWAEMVDRAASWFSGTNKCVDFIRGGLPNVGKTTFFRLLSQAFPGAVERFNGKKVMGQASSRFTPIEGVLPSHIVLVIDECGHIPHPVSAADLNTLCDDALTVEYKGVQMGTYNRIGTVCFVGHAWPRLKVEEQGMQTRLRWAHDMPDSLGELSEEDRTLMVESEKAVGYLRALIVRKTVDALANGTAWEVSKEAKVTVQEMIELCRDPFIAALTNAFHTQKNGFVPSTAIKAVLSEVAEDDEVPMLRQLAELMRTAFGGNAISTTSRIDGKKTRGWKGIAAKNQEELV